MAGQEIPEKKKEAEKRREVHVSVNNLILMMVFFRLKQSLVYHVQHDTCNNMDSHVKDNFRYWFLNS
jgi:hypothetical protein